MLRIKQRTEQPVCDNYVKILNGRYVLFEIKLIHLLLIF
jgi:hypothetical protein